MAGKLMSLKGVKFLEELEKPSNFKTVLFFHIIGGINNWFKPNFCRNSFLPITLNWMTGR